MKIWPFFVPLGMGYSVYILLYQTHDWELFHSILCKSRNQASQIESYIKKMKSRKYIRNVKEYPEIADKLKIQYP